MSTVPNQPFDPLATKHKGVAEKLNRGRRTLNEVSAEVSEERSGFFDKLAILNAGALTFSVTLLNPSASSNYPQILFVLYVAWALLLIALAACLLRNISHQGYRFSEAMAQRMQGEIEYIDVDTEIVSAKSPAVVYADSSEPFDLAEELKINKNNRERWHGELLTTQARVERYWKTSLASEFAAGLGMSIGFLLLIVFAILKTGDVSNKKYEVVGRAEKEVPNYQIAGTHTAVDYVLLQDGHKIFATCDTSDISNLDPTATCGFRPLRTYECHLQSDSIEKATFPLSDLKCKDADGHNVYLYVNKKE